MSRPRNYTIDPKERRVHIEGNAGGNYITIEVLRESDRETFLRLDLAECCVVCHRALEITASDLATLLTKALDDRAEAARASDRKDER